MTQQTSTESLTRFGYRVGLAVLITGIAGGAIAAVIGAIDIFLILFMGILFGVFLTKLSRGLSQRLPLRYGGCVAAVVLSLILAGTATTVFFGVRIDQKIQQARDHADEAQQELRRLVSEYPTLRSIVVSTPFVKELVEDASSSRQSSSSASRSSSRQTQNASQPAEGSTAQNGRSQDGTAQPAASGGMNTGMAAMQGVAKQGAEVIAGIFRTTFGLVINSVLIFLSACFWQQHRLTIATVLRCWLRRVIARGQRKCCRNWARRCGSGCWAGSLRWSSPASGQRFCWRRWEFRWVSLWGC